jgi:hypothetical protein
MSYRNASARAALRLLANTCSIPCGGTIITALVTVTDRVSGVDMADGCVVGCRILLLLPIE